MSIHLKCNKFNKRLIIDEYDLLGVTLDETQVEKEGF